VIGDEMGLGKTIQAIAAVELFVRHFGAERVLVICPTSLKHQWLREISKFTDRQALVIGGPRAARAFAVTGGHRLGIELRECVSHRGVESS